MKACKMNPSYSFILTLMNKLNVGQTQCLCGTTAHYQSREAVKYLIF